MPRDSPDASVGVVARPHVYACVRSSPKALVDRQHLHGMVTTITLRVLELAVTTRSLAAAGDHYAFFAWCLASIADCLEQLLSLRGSEHVAP